MNRTPLLMIAELLIFAVVDVVLLMFMDFSPSTVQIVALVLMNVSFAVLLVSPLLVPKTENSYVFSVSMSLISIALVAVEFVLGVVFILLDWDNITVVSVVMVFFLVVLFALMIMEFGINRESAAYEDSTRGYRREYVIDAEKAMETAMDSAARNGMESMAKTIEHAYDAFRSMPKKSKPETVDIDRRICEMAEEISALVSGGDENEISRLCTEMEALIDTRNVAFRKAQT